MKVISDIYICNDDSGERDKLESDKLLENDLIKDKPTGTGDEVSSMSVDTYIFFLFLNQNLNFSWLLTYFSSNVYTYRRAVISDLYVYIRGMHSI